jgi:hypothetical protein
VFRLLLLFALFWVIAQVFWRFIEGVVRGATTPPPGAGRAKGQSSPVKMQPCPVCGTYVVPGKAISAQSSTGLVHFCSDKCRSEYAAR